RGALSPPVVDAQLIRAHAVRRRTVEIGIAWQARFDTGFDPGVAVRMVVAQVRHAEFARRAVIGAGTAGIVLDALEVGQYVDVAPPVRALRRPVVEILMLAA